MNNKDLKEIYNQMHSQGPSAWFSDGKEERELILKMGEPWGPQLINGKPKYYVTGKTRILEIGCGEGDLGKMIYEKASGYHGIDYSEIAINKAQKKYSPIPFWVDNYKTMNQGIFDRIVMQGVLEHLDDPFQELKWMMDNLLTKKSDVITSSPCFLNPRGIIWMTLDMLGVKISKTDLHFLHPWEFEDFAEKNEYKIEIQYCDWSWGNDIEMWSDLSQRIPLALKDSGLPYKKEKINAFIEWLYIAGFNSEKGATAVYKISK